MRTSGGDHDTLLYVFPAVVLTVLTVIWMGGPKRAVELIDSSIVDGLHWVRSQW